MTYRVKGLYTRFKGRFYGKFAIGDSDVEQLYLERKEKALADSEKTSMTSAQVKFKDQRDLLIFVLRKNLKLSYREMGEMFSEYELPLSYVQIRSICVKFGDKESKKDQEDMKEEELKADAEKVKADEEKAVDLKE